MELRLPCVGTPPRAPLAALSTPGLRGRVPPTGCSWLLPRLLPRHAAGGVGGTASAVLAAGIAAGGRRARARGRAAVARAAEPEVERRLAELRGMRLRDLKRELQALGCRTDGCVDRESLLELLETQGASAIMQAPPGSPQRTTAGNPIATFDTSMGVFEAEVFLEEMPLTASNFISLAKEGFYNGVHFHRVIPGFMAQFGCPYARDPQSRRAGTGGPEDGTKFRVMGGQYDGKDIARINGGCIPDEFTATISNAPGTLSMANTGRPNSGGSQFFINVGNNARLDWFSGGESKHPVFAKVVNGFDVVQSITNTPTQNDNPVEPVMMKSITVAL